MQARHRSFLVAASGLLLAMVAVPGFADQKIKTKSNIKNDRIASTCGEDCAAAGRQWAMDNRVTDAAACESSSEAFTQACKAHVAAAKDEVPPSK